MCRPSRGKIMIVQPDAETFLAVVLGAALATVGGFSERQPGPRSNNNSLA